MAGQGLVARGNRNGHVRAVAGSAMAVGGDVAGGLAKPRIFVVSFSWMVSQPIIFTSLYRFLA